MSEIRVGLSGAGSMGRAVARMVSEVSEDFLVTAVHDPDPEAVVASRKLFGDAFEHCNSFDALLAREDIGWVMVASWNCDHAAQVIAAFEAGKHVFCQKPLALSLEECLAMRAAWKRSGREFVIGFNLRYSPHYRKIHELLAGNRIGRIISLEFNETLDFNHGGFIMGDWRRHQRNAGTHLLEKCSHDIDLANWLVGSRVTRAASFGGLDFFVPANEPALARVGKTRSGRQGYQTWREGKTLNPFTSDKDILDNQVTILEYANGVRATFHMNSNTALPERRMYICGTEGTLRADLHTGRIELRRIGFGEETEVFAADENDLHGGGDRVLAEELWATMRNGSKPSTTLEDGLEAAVTCFAVDEAERTGRVVDLAPWWQEVDA